MFGAISSFRLRCHPQSTMHGTVPNLWMRCGIGTSKANWLLPRCLLWLDVRQTIRNLRLLLAKFSLGKCVCNNCRRIQSIHLSKLKEKIENDGKATFGWDFASNSHLLHCSYFELAQSCMHFQSFKGWKLRVYVYASFEHIWIYSGNVIAIESFKLSFRENPGIYDHDPWHWPTSSSISIAFILGVATRMCST